MAEASATNPPENETSKNSKGSPQIGASLYMEEHLSDIIITLHENDTIWRFPAHSIILAARSNVFEKMLIDDFTEKRTKRTQEIRLQDMSPKTLKKLLRFLYIGDANLECWKEAFDLLKVGHRYQMTPLVQTCFQYLQKHANLSNVCYIYRKSAMFNLINLKDFCLEMMQNTACIILRSQEFEFLDEESVINIISSPSLNIDNEMCVIKAVIRWAATQCCRQSKPITEENISQIMVPFVKYLNTESITEDEFETLPKFLHANKNVFSRQNFFVSQHLQNNASHVSFKTIYPNSGYITHTHTFNQSTIFFTFNVDYPLFLIGVNLIYGNELYDDDYVILHTKTASVTTTVFQCSVGNNTPQTCPCVIEKVVMKKIEVLLNSSVLLQPHTVYQLGLRSKSGSFVRYGRSEPKSKVIFPKTCLIPINEVDYTDSAPFTIHTDAFWGVTKLLYLRTPVPNNVRTENHIFSPM